jgi:hypothetical protein
VCEYLAGNAAVPVTCVHVAPSFEFHMSLKGRPLYPAITHILLLYTTLECPYLAGKLADIVASVQYTPVLDTGVGTIGAGIGDRFNFLHPETAIKSIVMTKKTAAFFFKLMHL